MNLKLKNNIIGNFIRKPYLWFQKWSWHAFFGFLSKKRCQNRHCI